MRLKTFMIALVFFGIGFGTGYILSHYSFDFKITKDLKFSGMDSQRQISSEGQLCNENIPKYQQPGCIEKNQKQEGMIERAPSYKGKPCDPSIPKYSQMGCIEE